MRDDTDGRVTDAELEVPLLKGEESPSAAAAAKRPDWGFCTSAEPYRAKVHSCLHEAEGMKQRGDGGTHGAAAVVFAELRCLGCSRSD